jgi:hypothetical protein
MSSSVTVTVTGYLWQNGTRITVVLQRYFQVFHFQVFYFQEFYIFRFIILYFQVCYVVGIASTLFYNVIFKYFITFSSILPKVFECFMSRVLTQHILCRWLRKNRHAYSCSTVTALRGMRVNVCLCVCVCVCFKILMRVVLLNVPQPWPWLWLWPCKQTATHILFKEKSILTIRAAQETERNHAFQETKRIMSARDNVLDYKRLISDRDRGLDY